MTGFIVAIDSGPAQGWTRLSFQLSPSEGTFLIDNSVRMLAGSLFYSLLEVLHGKLF
jgi:hypothetical protein